MRSSNPAVPRRRRRVSFVAVSFAPVSFGTAAFGTASFAACSFAAGSFAETLRLAAAAGGLTGLPPAARVGASGGAVLRVCLRLLVRACRDGPRAPATARALPYQAAPRLG